MTNNNRFLLAFEKGHFDGLVDEGKYLRQSSLYKQILPRTPSRQILSLPTYQVGPRNLRNPCLMNYLCAYKAPFCAFLWLKNPFNLRNPRLINDLRSTKDYVRNYNKNMQNEPKFRKSQMNVCNYNTRDYEQMDTWSIRKNEPKRTQNEPKTNPKRTQTQKGQNERNFYYNKGI
jgi:hypothetical protein